MAKFYFFYNEFASIPFRGMLDYLIVPVRGCADNPFKAKEVVNDIWMEDCLDQGELLEIQAPIHRPINLDPELKPCAGVVIGITNYVGKERIFVTNLAEILGMTAQEIFAKRDKGLAKQSTHLICSNAEGSKYTAALKWKVPVVNMKWLLACLKDRTWVNEAPFLIGDSKTVTEGKPMPKEEEEENTLMEESSKVSTDEADEDEDIKFKTPKLTGKKHIEEEDEETPKIKKSFNLEDDDEMDIKFKTPKNDVTMRSKMLELETPGMDIEKLRPKPIDFEPSKTITPNRYAASQPSQGSPMLGEGPSTSTGRSSRRRNGKNESDETLPFYLSNIKTPETPYGAFLGKNPSPKTKKFWKKKCDEMGK